MKRNGFFLVVRPLVSFEARAELRSLALVPRLRFVANALLSCALFLFCQIASAQLSQTPTTSATTAVKPESTKALPQLTAGEHALKGGETHSYRIPLTPEQFFYALVEQKDTDVVVTSFGPDGKVLTETDSPNDRWGTEPILILANTPGDYRVDVRSSNNRAPAGRYEIKMIALRDATPLDKNHVAAEVAFNEGRKLRAQPASTAKRAALEKYRTALPLFQSVGDTYRQALTLMSTGVAYAQLNEFRRALEVFNGAFDLAKALGDRRLEAGMETFLGGMRDILGDFAPALDHYNRALVLSRATGNRLVEANTLNNIGKIYNDIADYQKALEYYGQALPHYRALGSQQREATTLNNIGIAYSMSGEQEKAREYLEQYLSVARSNGDKNAESYALSNLGTTYSRSGDYQKALTYFGQAQAIQRETGNRAQEAETLDLAGAAHLALGQPARALENHQQALEIHRTAGNLRREGMSLYHLGNTHIALGQPEKALAQFNPALSILRKIGDLNSTAVALEGSAIAERNRGNTEAARQLIEESLALVETVRARAGSHQLRSSYRASRDNTYQFYVELLMQLHAQSPAHGFAAEALQASERGRARSLLELLNEAHVDIRQGVDLELIERERNLTKLLNAKAQRHIQSLARKGGEAESATLEKELNSLENEYQQLQSSIRKTSPTYAALTQPKSLGLKEIQQQLDPHTLLLEFSLGAERSYLWAVTQSSLTVYQLPGRDEIQSSARQVYESLTTRSVTKPGETIADKRVRVKKADAQLLDASRELSQMILGPVASELGKKRLVIVADDALQYVPFAALPKPLVPGHQSTSEKRQRSAGTYAPLITDHEIITLPSASALAVQRRSLAGRKLANNAVAVIADPVFSLGDERLAAARGAVGQNVAQGDGLAATRIIEHLADDSGGKLAIRRLRFTRQEAEQILAVAPRTTNLKALDFKANRATATEGELSRYRYVHFATHGYLDSERPDLSAIVLSLVDEQGKPQDGFLRAHEIYNLSLPAELVVLSACETGLGKEIKGEGLVGLTRGFMYAGARRVVVSLWNVNDKATAELMQRFYSGMLREKQTPAAALRKAQVEMSQLKRWQPPYYWAAFVLQGEWR